jgi:hypothetical protein
MVLNKLQQVIVAIGKQDWPHSDPNFLNNLFVFTQVRPRSWFYLSIYIYLSFWNLKFHLTKGWCKNPETIRLGLSFLKIVSEEFVSTKEDLLSARKKELEALLLQQMRTILGWILDWYLFFEVFLIQWIILILNVGFFFFFLLIGKLISVIESYVMRSNPQSSQCFSNPMEEQQFRQMTLDALSKQKKKKKKWKYPTTRF